MIITITGISPLELDALHVGEKISNVLLDKYRELNEGEAAEDLAHAIAVLNVRELWAHKYNKKLIIAIEADNFEETIEV